MAFSTARGRPRTRPDAPDYGTPELRMKRTFNLTDEPLDLCLSRGIITAPQHRAGMHLRWLYTIRYGAPVITTRYDHEPRALAADKQDEHWRALREEEYASATTLLRQRGRYEPVLRLCVFNELPPFMDRLLIDQSWQNPALAKQLDKRKQALVEGLDLLRKHWKS